MGQQRHIINEQLIEMHIPETSDAFAMQQTLGNIYREQLMPLIDKQLTERYGNDEHHYRINTLTIDLGEVQVEDIATVFAEKLAGVLASDGVPKPLNQQERSDIPLKPDETPLEVLSHYLMTGLLPWWASDTTKAYLFEQLEALLKTPDATFKALLGQLRNNSTYLNRFLNTFMETQVLRSLQLLTTISLNGLSDTKNKLIACVREAPGKGPRELSAFSIAKALWIAIFQQLSTAGDYPELERRAVYHALETLNINIDPNAAEKWFSSVQERAGSVKEVTKTALPEIRLLVESFTTKYPENAVWQQFFQQCLTLLQQPSVHLVNPRLLNSIKQLLTDLDAAQHKSVQAQHRQKQHAAGEGTDSAIRLKTITKANLQPLAKQLHVLETTLKQTQPVPKPNVMEKLQSGFEDTDFITVQNAGLVILWPFLQRFFEHLELMTEKTFYDNAAMSKAACVLQYLVEEEEMIFEGALILNKVLCGIPPEDTVKPVLLSDDEKAIAEGLLQSVIARGPHWKSLSPEGFQTSYLQREGLLRTRDDHWLLQIKKETYDVTLEKLPWGFAAVKLPWMPEPLMVEWV